MNKTTVAKIADIVLSLLILAAVILALLWFVHAFNVFKLPAFIENVFWPKEEPKETTDVYEEKLIALVEKQPYISGEYELVTLTADKALELLSGVVPVSDFFWNVETTYRHDSDIRTQKHMIYKKGDKVRVDTVEDGSDTTTVFLDGNTTVLDNETGESITFSGDTEFDYTELVNIAALKNALENTTTSVNEIAIAEFENEKYLYVEIPKPVINGTDVYFISLDYGLVLEATSSLDGKVYFTQKTQTFDANSVISDNAFDVTDLKTAEPPELR